MRAAPGRWPGARAAAIAAMFACCLRARPVSAQENAPSPPIDSRAAQQDLPANNDVYDGTENTDVGLLQIEIGSQWTDVDADSRSAGLPFTARFGASAWLELSVSADLLARQSEPTGNVHGLGDTQVGGRVRLFGKAGGLPPLSVIPQLNLPTADAATGLGTGHVDPSLALLSGRDFPHGSHVDVSCAAGAVGEGEGQGRFAQYAAALSGSLGVTPVWTPALTIAWVSRQDADTGEAWLLSADSVFTASRRMAFDLSVQFGLTSEAPRLGVGGGLSFVLGGLDPEEGVHARRHRLRFWARHRRTPRPPSHH